MVTRSDELWDLIRALPVELYALPNQVVEQHVERLKITDDAVHLRLKSPAVLPALEEVLKRVKPPKGQKFDIVQTKEFIVFNVVSDTGV